MPALGKSEDLVEHGNWAENIVEKYNATAQKLLHAQAEIHQVQQEQGRHVEELQKMALQNNELDAKQAKMIEELQKADKETEDQIHKLMDERISATKAEVEKAVRNLDEALTPKFGGLERAIEDLVSQQKEMQAKTLPRWRADVGSEIQSLRTDFSKHCEHAEANQKDQSAAIAKVESAAAQALANLEQKLMAEVSQLTTDLGKANQTIESLTLELAGTKKSLVDLGAEHEKEKAAVAKRFEGLEHTQSAHKDDSTKFVERLDKSEKVIQQVLYDFEDQKSKVDSKLASEREKTEAKLGDQDKMREEVEKQLRESMSKSKEEIEKVLATQVDVLTTKIAAADEKVVTVTAAESKHGDEIAKLGELLEQKYQHLDQQSKSEAKKVLQDIRSNEGQRLATLEGTVKEVQSANTDASKKQQQDVSVLKEQISSAQGAVDLKIKDLDSSSQNRLQVIQQAVDELAQLFQEFGVLQQNQEGGLKELETLVKAIEVKIWPWRARNRSQSPSGSHRPPTGRSSSATESHRRTMIRDSAAMNGTASTDVPTSEKVSDGFASTKDMAPPGRLRPISARPRMQQPSEDGDGGISGISKEFGSAVPVGAARNTVVAKSIGRLNR